MDCLSTFAVNHQERNAYKVADIQNSYIVNSVISVRPATSCDFVISSWSVGTLRTRNELRRLLFLSLRQHAWKLELNIPVQLRQSLVSSRL